LIVVHGVGPVYWGVEREARADPKVVSTAWLLEIEPPYRESYSAIRVRFGDRAVHLGLCKKNKDTTGIDMIGRTLDLEASDIAKWGTQKQILCPECDGEGVDGASYDTCGWCLGTGYVEDEDDEDSA